MNERQQEPKKSICELNESFMRLSLPLSLTLNFHSLFLSRRHELRYKIKSYIRSLSIHFQNAFGSIWKLRAAFLCDQRHALVGFHHCGAQHGILSGCLIFEMIVCLIAGIQVCGEVYLTQARTNDYAQSDWEPCKLHMQRV